VIRGAEVADVPARQRLAHDAYGRYVPRMDRPPAPMLADYAAMVREGLVQVAIVDHELVGLLVTRPADDHLFIENIAVAPQCQGRGVGRELIAVAEAEARRLQLGELRLYTNEVMVESLAFYARLGFTETHRALQDGYRRVFLAKPV
jgi:ribosomal protein S18 acetylase RimI-like enzyme